MESKRQGIKSNSLVTKLIPVYRRIKRIVYAGDLNKLALIHGTDKFGHHNYTPNYSLFFQALRKQHISLLEIGIGGYENTKSGAHSLKMWKDYFSNGKIYGLDLHDKKTFEEERIKIYQGDQTDKNILDEIIKNHGLMDIIIDDGSHIPAHQILSFKMLFRHLKPGGYYAVEDTAGNYTPDWGGSKDINDPNTFLAFARQLTDCVNAEHLNGRLDNLKDFREIEFVYFFKDLVIFRKRKA